MRSALPLLLGVLVAAAPARAQEPEIRLDVLITGGPTSAGTSTSMGGSYSRISPTVTTAGILQTGRTPDLLRNGFPAKLRYRLELWRKGSLLVGDEREAHTAWDVFVSYDPSSQTYRVVRQHGNDLEDFGGFATLPAAEAQLDRPYAVALPPRHGGAQYYYNLTLDIETLSLTDLGELQRWLRGEVQPAVRGEGNPATALSRGIGTLISRVLGGDRRRYAQRSDTFRT